MCGCGSFSVTVDWATLTACDSALCACRPLCDSDTEPGLDTASGCPQSWPESPSTPISLTDAGAAFYTSPPIVSEDSSVMTTGTGNDFTLHRMLRLSQPLIDWPYFTARCGLLIGLQLPADTVTIMEENYCCLVMHHPPSSTLFSSPPSLVSQQLATWGEVHMQPHPVTCPCASGIHQSCDAAAKQMRAEGGEHSLSLHGCPLISLNIIQAWSVLREGRSSFSVSHVQIKHARALVCGWK